MHVLILFLVIYNAETAGFIQSDEHAVLYLFDHQGCVILVSLHIIIAFVNTFNFVSIFS